MVSYPSLIWRIISLLLLIIQDRVGSTSLGGDIIADTNLTLNGSPYVVSQDLVVAENTTLTIQPGVQLHFDVGVGLQVKGALHAKGNPRERIVFTKTQTNSSGNLDDLNVTAPYNKGIRLSDGHNYRVGRLEIFLRGQWGTVCDNWWDMSDTQVACRQLGFLEAKTYYRHGGGTGPTWLDRVNCKGTEASLLECSHRGVGIESCSHYEDIGIECTGLAKLLPNWKGIEFSSAEKPSSLYHAEVSNAYEAIKAHEFLPDLEHVTVKSSVYGVRSDNASCPLTISDSIIRDNIFAGIQIKGRSKDIVIKNTEVDNTTYGHGLNYTGIAPDVFDFCSANMDNITSFPISFQAFGQARTTVDCAKIIRTQPEHHLTVYYQSMTGVRFELEVHDGNTTNATRLTLVNQWTGVNQAVTPSSSSGHELYIRFRFIADSRDADVKFFITADEDVSSLLISNCTFNDNYGKGVSLNDFIGKVAVSTTTVYRNKGEGMTVERISGTITATDTHVINNSANGLEILDSSFLLCNLHQLSAKGNIGDGLYLQRVALKSNVSQSAFDGNTYNGIEITKGAGEVEFRNTTAVLNRYNGLYLYDGQVSSTFKSCNFSSNKEDGCTISNQAGAHLFFNCTANYNLRHGVSLFDPRYYKPLPRYYFNQFSLRESNINDNTQYGVRLAPEYQRDSDSTINLTIVITKNRCMRNSMGGIFLSPEYYYRWYWNIPRRVEAIVTGNHFEQNKVNGFYVYCTGGLGLEAVIEANTFINNTDKVLTLVDNDNCGANYRSTYVNVKIDKNIFMKNRAENVLYIDYGSFPEMRSAVVNHNNFKDNEVATKDLFPRFFRRTTTRAVIVLKEGSFTLRENSLENVDFAFQLSTLRHDHRQSIDAKFNWWGASEECKIVDRIFDFKHRVQLSPVNFFPYFLSANMTSTVSTRIPRPSCFLRDATIGGILDRPLALSSAVSSYEVRDDIIILTNGSLIVPKNVTLQFPSRSAMVVQGTLLVDGTENEKVRFTKKQHQGGFRLSGGAGPWEGRVEFLVNGSWWPMCLSYWRSFTSEAKIICQQLDLYYYYYSRRSSPGQEAGFVHNVVCDGNTDSDIMNCSVSTWSYGPTCSGYAVYVYCRSQQYNWAGIHLTMTHHQSSLRHLEIHDAGYAYRSDIQISGAALQVDLNHHDISNIFIDNSLGIGVQVMYQSLFHKQSLMPYSVVQDTESHGVLSRSPSNSLALTDVNLTRNDGNGFVYETTWDKLSTFTAEMASTDVHKTLHVCSENKTFLLANKVFYFTLETLEDSLQLRCQHGMETEPGYKLVIQELYHSSSYHYYRFLNVYDGTNISVGSPWNMGSSSRQDHAVFNSTNSTIVFDLYKRGGWNFFSIFFLVYTVKENEQLGYIGAEIIIDRVKITGSLQGGILIGGNVLKSLTITNTDVTGTNSRDFGIQLTARDIEVVKIISTNLQNNWQGIDIDYIISAEVTIENCAINDSGYYGIYISPRDIDVIKIISTNLQQNRRGIRISMSSTELTIENSVINGTVYGGVYIYASSTSTIQIVSSSFTASGDRGLYIYDYTYQTRPNLFLNDSTFSWNTKGALYYYNRYYYYYSDSPAIQLFKSNHFFRNQGPTVEIRGSATCVFLNNTFQENRGISVISLDNWYSHGGIIALAVQGNLFMANQCPDNAVINIKRSANHVIIRNNNFAINSGRCVLLEGMLTHSLISISDNLFNENNCADKSVIEVLRLDEKVTFSNNSFTHNTAKSVILLQVIHDIHSSLQRKQVSFNNNTLSNNIAYTSSRLSIADDSCAFVLSGVHYYKEIDFGFNKFNNVKYRRELCIRFPAFSTRDVVNVTHNWWGTANESEVRDRISDFDDDYDFAIANDWPFLISDDDPTLTAIEKHDIKQHGSVLSGRLFESITLKAAHSPYSVTSDLIVLDNITLTIEAGVTVTVSPGMSILVAGALKAQGTPVKPVLFTVKEPAGSDEDSHLPVRLVEGDFPWEGRAEVFHNKSWKPIFASSNMFMWNTTEVICKQLGYGPPVAAKRVSDTFSQNMNRSRPVEFICHGNETFVHECSTKHKLFNYSNSNIVVNCQGAPWGNLRFVSSNDVNVSQMQSVLNHVEFSYCGNRHGIAVPAIEAVTNIPKLKSISIRNCSSGGLRIYSPRTEVHLNNSTFVNTGEAGISIVRSRHSILVESSELTRNKRGISYEEANAENIPQVYYGRMFLCSEEKTVLVKNQTHLYFGIPRLKDTSASLTCQRVLTVTKGHGIKLTLLYFKGTNRLKIYDSANTVNLIVDRSYSGLTAFVHKEIYIPRDAILVQWSGNSDSEVVILVEDMNINDSPCTYELDFCGWQTFNNMSINGLNVTKTWKIARYSWPHYVLDYSYVSNNGKLLYISNDYWPYDGGRAAIISPRITKLSQLCFVVFFYRLGRQGRARLSLYIQTGTFPTMEQSLIWSAKNIEVSSWRKVVVELPSDIDEYRLLLEGEYNETSSYYSRNYVTIDNLELRSCSVEEHRISNSVFSDNVHQAISYTSVADGSDRRPSLTIERCKIIDTPASHSNLLQKSTISLDIQDNNFTLANNFISGNRLGVIRAQLGRSDGTSEPKSLIYGNTFSSNANGIILVQERKELKRNYSFVHIVDNMFESNLGYGSTIKLFEVRSQIVNNFFYNNSGLHSIEYEFSNPLPKKQRCELNTFYLNKGLGQNYGATILSNGPMEYHRNNLKNPSNIYELSSTRQPVTDPIDATLNWWGVGIDSSVRSRIYEKEDDNRLAAVEYKPFQKLPPKNILSIGCPVGWLYVNTTCFVFRGGSLTLKEAKDYCLFNGGHVASTSIPDDMEFINMAFQVARPDGKPPVPIWVTTEENVEGENSGEQASQRCTVLTQNRAQKVVPCKSLYPFVCTRTAVIRCSNNCFHNGDCFGATCVCHRGWTGADCSQFHCNDVHNCSGNGQCVGPNVCKCTPGFIGRGCSYSYCTKFLRCSTCSQDQACGWCDSSQQCMPGTPKEAYAEQCPDWFYHTCYSVGSVRYCSNKIQRVDCTNRQCNFTQETTNSETCQKCEDLDKCYNKVEQGKCRAWNETRCPHGLVQVDYTDPNRINNTIIRSNVKIIDPNTTVIYSCPVLLPDLDDTTSVFVAPKGLGIKVGDVLSSGQAGGMMHKVNGTTATGPFTIILGTPAQIEDIIQYADFSQKVSPVQMVDETTLDEEPDLDDLHGLLDGNVTLNTSDLHVLPANTSVFKCVGHIYKVDDDSVSTQFLVINRDHAISVRPGDVVVSAQSHGFIEKVVRINQTSDVVFMETELERCTENSTWLHRFNPRVSGSSSDDDVVCTGGDNSYSLVISEPDPEQQQISVNDSIIGRSSNPFIAKVVESHMTGDFMLIEVLQVQSIINGTAETAAGLEDLRKQHRRRKRAVKTIKFRRIRKKEQKFSVFGKGYINVQQKFEIYADFIVSIGTSSGSDKNGEIINKDAVLSLKMDGGAKYKVDAQIGIKHNVDFKKTFPILRPVQLGPTFWICIPITFIPLCIPCAFFLETNLEQSIKAAGNVFVPLSMTASARLQLGGFCTKDGGCQSIKPQFEVDRTINIGPLTAEAELVAESLFIPKLTFRVPTKPRSLKLLMNMFNKLFKKILGYKPGKRSKRSDWSILRLSVEMPYRLKGTFKSCSSACTERKPHEFMVSFGFSEIVGRLAIGFGKKNYELPALSWKLFSGGKEKSVCLPCENSKLFCSCPTTPSPSPTTSTFPTTPPPTTSPPCECANGENGITGPYGSCDCPPECPEGKKPVVVNNRYKCPDHPPCGEPPNCVVGRRGTKCSQPDVQPCSADCSGNGFAMTTADCGSRCVCSARWTGTCCERRRPQRNWGDPHLETLDGIEYDYYGIGEFWGCKSLFNDFGMQFRFFAYQRASLTGGVALKAGQSVLSIMTVSTSDPREFPKLRIDGTLVNITARIGQKTMVNNATVVLDIQKTASSQSDETGVVLISLQYQSGLTLTFDVRHSHVMGRQYLNALFTPIVAFKGHTEGLCGVMDNDPSNDLKGPRGEQYNDPIQFADSWRITAFHNNSGLQGTWSWNSSNFHSGDVMDSSYNDPNYVPMYSLDGIDDVIVAKATTACLSLGLSDAMLKSCIYDVAVTNDTSLTDQETLKQDCPDQCSGKGRCVNSTCQCMIGWSGDSCELGDCTNCSAEHGICVKGFCECEDGWEGVTCEQKATCYGVNNCTSPNNGICWRTDECRCHDGYIGRDCSIIPTCSNVSDCSGRGICVDYDVCKCQKEWTGKDCTQFSCASLDHCSGRGSCVALYKCDCIQGWAGDSCALPDCAGVNQCSGHGECVSSDTCQCYPGFQGVNCSDVADCASLGNCSGNGACMQEKGGNLTCRCYAGFSGANCSLVSCVSVNNCSGHGVCVEANFCKCDQGYTGADCSNASCEALNYCSGHGVCIGYDTCTCDPLWHGPACSEADCSSLNHCSNKGDCILPDTCECYPGYDGAACNTTAKPNFHAPVFTAPFYNASLLENSPIGTKVLQVQASDADSGRNAQFFFSLDDTNAVSSSFTIDTISGEVFTSSNLDYESSSSPQFKLKIVASDNGRPVKSSFVFMYINILDVNDHCPVFESLQSKWLNISQDTHPGTLLMVISATDQDSGLNGEVRYSLSHAIDQQGTFELGKENGELKVAKELQEKEYRLVIIARDLGTPSCSRQTDVTVDVFAEPAVTKAPGEISTAVNTEVSTENTSTTEATGTAQTTTTTTATVTASPSAKEIPASSQTSKWFKSTPVITGISVGAFVVFAVVLIIVITVSCRKQKRRPKATHRASSFPGATTGSAFSVNSTTECGITNEIEMENIGVSLDEIKG